MLNKITSLLRSINSDKNPNRKLKILCAPTHEAHASSLCKTGHEFYLVTGPGIKPTFDTRFRKLPDNFYVYNLPYDQIRGDQGFDLILSQEKGGQYPFFKNLSDRTGVPLCTIEHTHMPPNWPDHMKEDWCNRRGITNIFITKANFECWKGQSGDYIIPHGIDDKIFTNYSGDIPRGISVVNRFKERDMFCGWTLWNEIRKDVPIDLIGDNPGISEPIGKIEVLAEKLSHYRFFCNSSTLSPCPMSLLEGMVLGMPVISTANQEVPNIITHGVDGFLSNNPKELAEYGNMLINDFELAKKIGAAGREKAIKMFGMDRFINQYNAAFYECVDNFHKIKENYW